jgi:NAD(P)-dependent dehydrogenase (short-subunit alcohol dehydrogenase family)
MTATQAASGFAEFPLAGRHAVVTGGGSGIGGAIADALARLGADVTIMGRRMPVLEAHAATLARRHGTQIEAVALDLARQESVAAVFRVASERLGHPAILVNNAGVAKAAPFSKTDPALWQEVIDIDLTGAYLCIRETMRHMIKNGYGRIVNIASTAGLTGYPYVAAYCAAKHGLIGLTRALAREAARTAVTVNAVCPGYTDTAIVEDAVTSITAKTGRAREQALAELVAHNPQGRLILPAEVAETVGWLCLSSSASITGQSIVVAGGELM